MSYPERMGLQKSYLRKKIVFPPKTRKSQVIKRQLKKSEGKPWNAWRGTKNQMNLLGAAPKRAEEAGVMRLNS